MKRTRKWVFVAQEARRLASMGLKPSEVARRVGVTRQAVLRWMASGLLADTRRGSVRPGTAVVPDAPRLSPAEWAASVRVEYSLDATDEQLVMLAEAALRISLDPATPARLQMAATDRFQALARQLALVARQPADGTHVPATPAAKRSVRPRPSVDPRALLTSKFGSH